MFHLLVTGGAGFIGSHATRRFLDRGWKVTVFDNMSRLGCAEAVAWMQSHPQATNLSIIRGDVRDADAIRHAAADADAILHAAGQTAVTKSVTNPREDFESNALGTLNLLEAARASGRKAAILFTSTNKVYGGMEETGVVLRDQHYGYESFPNGVPESQPLDFHSPYGCSKGAADQYIRDYSRIYDLPTIVFRQSCIYGTWQFGTEDQGWLAHFAIAAVLDKPITIFGDGMQVRDALYIEDLVDAFEAAFARSRELKGQIFNIGGGPTRAISLLDLITQLESLRGSGMQVSYDDWRPGDQRVYISDVSKAQQHLGWSPRIDVSEGVRRLYTWVQVQREMIQRVRYPQA